MFKRIANLFKGFLGLFVSGLEKANPEALLEVEKENLRKQIANYNQGLASHAGLCERLMSQVKKLETEERELHAKAAAHSRRAIAKRPASMPCNCRAPQRSLPRTVSNSKSGFHSR